MSIKKHEDIRKNNKTEPKRKSEEAARNSLKFYELWAQFFIFYDFSAREEEEEAASLRARLSKGPSKENSEFRSRYVF